MISAQVNLVMERSHKRMEGDDAPHLVDLRDAEQREAFGVVQESWEEQIERTRLHAQKMLGELDTLEKSSEEMLKELLPACACALGTYLFF